MSPIVATPVLVGSKIGNEKSPITKEGYRALDSIIA